jgi:hypothetical protein
VGEAEAARVGRDRPGMGVVKVEKSEGGRDVYARGGPGPRSRMRVGSEGRRNDQTYWQNKEPIESF